MKDTYIDTISIVEGVEIRRYETHSWQGYNGYHIVVVYKSKPRRKDYYYLTLEGLVEGTRELITEYKNKGFNVLEEGINLCPYPMIR